MPRGSKPGERRGGRRRGTPNKKTALHNAVLCAAAAKPDGSPLDFMLGLMRDPNVPTDLRVEMAAVAAPFVHARPQAPPRKRTNPMDSSSVKEVANSTAQKMEEKLNAPEQLGHERPNEAIDFESALTSTPEISLHRTNRRGGP
jgi:hypothetical protein